MIGSTKASTPTLLHVSQLSAGYGKARTLHGISLDVATAQIVCVLGANGAGKTTLLRALSGLLPVQAGTITLQDQVVTHMPAETLVRRGVVHVPQGRMVFARLTVRENLLLGGYTRNTREVHAHMAHVLDYFPQLKQRYHAAAGTLSGGEQQMLAIVRGLLAKPRLLMLDEPSMGVAPILKEVIFSTLRDIRAHERLGLLIVEQDVDMALDISDIGYVIETGRVVMQGLASDLADNAEVRRAYLGG